MFRRTASDDQSFFPSSSLEIFHLREERLSTLMWCPGFGGKYNFFIPLLPGALGQGMMQGQKEKRRPLGVFRSWSLCESVWWPELNFPAANSGIHRRSQSGASRMAYNETSREELS